MRNPFKEDASGLHLAANIFIATTILWVVLRHWAGLNPIWAISSMIAASNPQVKQALKTIKGRLVNALIGCATGLFVLGVGGSSEWKIPLALALSVLISSYVVRIQVMFRQAPITAAIVVAGGLADHSKTTGMEEGARRVGEVLLGCVLGLLVTWGMSKLWPLPETKQEVQPAKASGGAG